MSERNSARLVGGPSPMALKIANVISERNALRAELKAASRQIEQEQAIAAGLQSELDRMRAALEVRTEYIHFPHVLPEFQDRNRRSAYVGGYAQGWAGKPLSRVYDADYMQCAYNAGHRAGNAEAEDRIERAINPQPAQQLHAQRGD